MQDVFLFIRDFFSNLNEDFMHATVPLALTFLGYLLFYGHPPPPSEWKLKVIPIFHFAVLADTQRLNLAFRFDIREISEIDDRKQYLSVPMYFSVAWLESRLWINETATAWDETVTGPQNVSIDGKHEN